MTLGIECLLTDDAGRAGNWPQAAGRHQPRAARGRAGMRELAEGALAR
jgi:hypothetical protein